MASVLTLRALAARPVERPDVLGALGGFSLGLSAFTAVHLVLYLRRVVPDGFGPTEKAWAALGVALAVTGSLNAMFVRYVLAAQGPRSPVAPREA